MAKKGTFESAGAALDRGINSVSNKAKEYADSFKRKAEEIGKSISTKAKRTYERASKFAQRQIDSGLQAVENIKGLSTSVQKQAREAIVVAGSAAKTVGYFIVGASIEFGSNIARISVNAKNKVITFTLKTGERINVRMVQPAIRSAVKGKEAVLSAFYTAKGLSIVAAKNIIALEKKYRAKMTRSFLKVRAELIKQGQRGIRVYHSMLSAINTAGNNAKRVMNASIAVVRALGSDVSRFVYNKSRQAVEVTVRSGKKFIIKVNSAAKASITNIEKQLERYNKIADEAYTS